MKIKVEELKKIIREAIFDSYDTDEEVEEPIVIQDPSGPLKWQEEGFHKYIYTKQGVYDWAPSTGHLRFVSNLNGRTTLLSKDLNPKRFGGFHDIKSEEQATERVKQHMARQKK